LDEGAQGGGTGEAFAGRSQENGVWGIKLQDGFELFGARDWRTATTLHPNLLNYL